MPTEITYISIKNESYRSGGLGTALQGVADENPLAFEFSKLLYIHTSGQT